MKKPAVLPVLAALEAMALGLGGLFWLRMRPDLLAAYGVEAHGAAVDLSWATRLALSAWFTPTMALGGAVFMAAGLALRGRMRTRTSLAGAGLVGTAFGVAFALAAAYAPAFEGLGP